MKKMYKIMFLILAMSIICLALSSCDPSGVCEVEKWGDTYYCSTEGGYSDCNTGFFTATRVHFHEAKNCQDIGYTIESDGSSIHFADEDSGPSPTGYFAGGGSSDDVSYYDYTFTCTDINETYTIEVPYKSSTCLDAKKFMTKTFTCNDVANMELSQQRCINECSAGREDCAEL